jgi:3-oxoacyl-[acyl-carrier protein] reductase
MLTTPAGLAGARQEAFAGRMSDTRAPHQNHVAIVTGGISGIGLGIARLLHAEGARIALWDRDQAGLARIAPTLGNALVVALDITDAHEVQRAADHTAQALGSIDILVNSAGITGPNTTVWDYPVAAWDQVIAVNLNGIFYACRAVVPHMLRGTFGRIVNIASIAGKEGNPNAAAYSASKAGVIGLTKSLGKELAASFIRVNCVTPAAVETPLFAQMTPAQIDYMKSKIPMARFGLVEEVAAMVGFLASAACSFSTGAVFDISGGRATY